MVSVNSLGNCKSSVSQRGKLPLRPGANWVSNALKAYADIGDIVILISSSGTSKNIVNAASYCNENNIPLLTLSGFKRDNPLSKLGDVNIHVESESYNFIEMSHHIILVAIVDIFAQKLA